MVPFLFHEREMLLSACGAIHWPAVDALLVADLHFEKASFYAGTGQFLPPYDSVETARALGQLVERTGARHVVCLGDSYHDADGAGRMQGDARRILLDIADQVEWLWITGNHDRATQFDFGRAFTEIDVCGLRLRHEAHGNDEAPEISGHFHPKIRLRHRGQTVVRRCFMAGGGKLIMPAFGALTGGLDVHHPAIRAAMPGPAMALVPTDARLLRFPLPWGRA